MRLGVILILVCFLAACQTVGKTSDTRIDLNENERHIRLSVEHDGLTQDWTGLANRNRRSESVFISGDGYFAFVLAGQLIRNRVWAETADEIGFKKLLTSVGLFDGASFELGDREEAGEGIGVVRSWPVRYDTDFFADCFGSIDNWGAFAGKASQFGNRVYSIVCSTSPHRAREEHRKLKAGLDVQPRYYTGTGIVPVED